MGGIILHAIRALFKYLSLVFMILFILTTTSRAFVSDGEEVSLEVNMLISQNGVALTMQTDVIVRLMYSGNHVSWEKSYSNTSIIDGVLNLSMSGEDDSGNLLIVDHFDEEDAESFDIMWGDGEEEIDWGDDW